MQYATKSKREGLNARDARHASARPEHRARELPTEGTLQLAFVGLLLTVSVAFVVGGALARILLSLAPVTLETPKP